MTLENIILQKLAEQAGSSKRHEFQAQDPTSGWNLYVTAERRDDLSCLIWELALRRAQAEEVGAWAKAVAGRTIALAEPLKVNEVDAGRQEALLRTLPIQRSGLNLYFEVLLNGSGAITLRRFQVGEEVGQRREQVAFALTHETLARVVGELAGA